MYCISCGVENLRSVQICKRCGKPLKYALDSQDNVQPTGPRDILERVFLITVYYDLLEWFVAKINAAQVRARNMASDSRNRPSEINNARKRARFILKLGGALIILYFLTKFLGILI